jgi:hypothetical protein
MREAEAERDEGRRRGAEQLAAIMGDAPAEIERLNNRVNELEAIRFDDEGNVRTDDNLRAMVEGFRLERDRMRAERDALLNERYEYLVVERLRAERDEAEHNATALGQTCARLLDQRDAIREIVDEYVEAGFPPSMMGRTLDAIREAMGMLKSPAEPADDTNEEEHDGRGTER